MDKNSGFELNMNMEVSVKLPASAWVEVLKGVDELPRRVANPIVDQINTQLIQAAKDANGPKEKVEEAGGEDQG